MTTPNTNHPAKFSPEVLAQLRVIVRAEALRLGRPPTVLDPFAGVGRIHDLKDIAVTTGVEIEPEWAACRAGTIVGNALDLPAAWTQHYDIVGTSPVYPNRMTDHHDPRDKCKRCDGEGKVGDSICPACKGKGLSRRRGYKFALGRDPSEGSAAILKWGDAYRGFHRAALVEMIRVTDEGGLVVVNMSNHYQSVKQAGGGYRSVLMRVVEWWVETMLAKGLYIEAVFPVITSRMRDGANYNLRAGVEQVIVMRKPWPIEETTP